MTMHRGLTTGANKLIRGTEERGGGEGKREGRGGGYINQNCISTACNSFRVAAQQAVWGFISLD